MALSVIFSVLMTAIVVPVIGFVVAFSIGSQGLLNVSTVALKWAFFGVGAVMVYGLAVGVYHTFLAVTGLDRGRRRVAKEAESPHAG